MIVCAGCGEPILGRHVYHARLGVRVHESAACMVDVNGEDIRDHTVLLVDGERR